MRISKLYLVVCAATLCAIPLAVRADDNPAQAAARAALEEQMRALDMQQAPTNAPAPAPATPAQPAQPAAATTPPATPTPAANPPATETNQAAAPATTTQTTNASNVQPAQPPPVAVTPSSTTAPPPTNPPAATAAMTPAPTKAPAASNSGSSLFGPVPPPSGGVPAGAMSEGSKAVTTSAAPTAVQTPGPGAVQSLPMEPSQNNNSSAIPGQQLGLKPIVAPPLPISADQQAQLRALLEKYDAGAITPVQYQTERAKILNQTH
ncbi:MAG TPA: hypothetical protein VJT54_04755 [Verrucomicrobiae bacterium]|nr:hypothetical protein [Verrucomicrobiae bacterium]